MFRGRESQSLKLKLLLFVLSLSASAFADDLSFSFKGAIVEPVNDLEQILNTDKEEKLFKNKYMESIDTLSSDIAIGHLKRYVDYKADQGLKIKLEPISPQQQIIQVEYK